MSIHNSLNLKIVPRAVSKVAALRRLDLSNNAISEIYAYTFFGSAKLSYLILEDNYYYYCIVECLKAVRGVLPHEVAPW